MVTPLCRVLEFSEEGWLLIVQDCSTGTTDLLPPCHHILMWAFMLNNTHVWYLTLFKVFSLIWSHWIIQEPWEASRHAHIWKYLRLELQSESDTTERLDFHFSLSCIGEGNGNPFQCSCLENPRDSGAWWAAVYGVAQSRTRLKQLSSSSSSRASTKR